MSFYDLSFFDISSWTVASSSHILRNYSTWVSLFLFSSSSKTSIVLRKFFTVWAKVTV